MNLNKAIIIGRLTKDPELKSIPSGQKVASFSIATSRVWKDKNGAKQEDSEFHNIVAWGKQAETIAMYVKKGDILMVEGRIQTRNWDGEKGKQYRTEIILEQFQFGPKRAGASTSAPAKKPETAEDLANELKDEAPTPPEDIPF